MGAPYKTIHLRRSGDRYSLIADGLARGVATNGQVARLLGELPVPPRTEKELSREAWKIAEDLAYRLQPFVAEEDTRKLQRALEGWVRVLVMPIIEEREEAVGRQFEMEEDWRARVARWLRRVARATEGS